MYIRAVLFTVVIFLVVMVGCTIPETVFLVRIENISGNSDTPTALAPGVFAVHTQEFQLFIAGEEDQGYGLESLAEDGSPGRLSDYLAVENGVFESGTFLSPSQDGNFALLFSSAGAYEFSFTANDEAQYLSFATKFVESNDLFFAPADSGIKLFRFGMPISGDVTRRILLWDLFTEINEEPGKGVYQAPRQNNFDSGPSETGPVSEVNDRFDYPPVTDLIRVTITPQ